MQDDDKQAPGQLIVPHDSDPTPTGAPEPERPDETPDPSPPPAPTPEPQTEIVQPVVTSSDVSPAPTPNASQEGWFHPEANDPVPTTPQQHLENLTWTAKEFVDHDKSAGWYGMFTLAVVVATVLVYLVTKDKVSTGVVLGAAIAFAVVAARKPHTLEYGLTSQGLQIGQRFYGFQDFKAFSISDEGSVMSVVLTPLKRFMPPRTIYMSPEVGANVVNFLSQYLPFEQHRTDAVDSLVRRIRF